LEAAARREMRRHPELFAPQQSASSAPSEIVRTIEKSYWDKLHASDDNYDWDEEDQFEGGAQ
jgi:hypothetical protein